MDFKLQEITLPAFLWYILSGLNFVLAVVAVPILLLNPKLLLHVSSVGGVVFVLLVALVAGFVMDSLKLYSLGNKHKKKKIDFFSRLAKELGATEENVAVLIDALRMGLPEHGSLGRAVAFNHSRWVMMTHSAKCFYLLAGLWLIISIALHSQDTVAWYQTVLGLTPGWPSILSDFALITIMTFIGYQMDSHANKQRSSCDQLYYAYARRHSAQLKEELLKPEQPTVNLCMDEFLLALRTAAQLKKTKRMGWQEHGLMEAESVADHTYMVCLLAYLLAPHAGVDRCRSVALALMHDVPESVVGDITPNDPRLSDKRELERKAADDLSRRLTEPDVLRLWHEVDEGKTDEAKFVRELDRLEAALQASIYEETDESLNLSEFYKSVRSKISSDLSTDLLKSIVDSRKQA